MDYEKKYKNALEWARQVMNGETGFIRKEVEEIFPELKESEDEKIRKELTEFLKKASGGLLDTTTHCKTFGKWLAWLENQSKYETIWKPTKEQITALTHFVRSVGESSYASPYDNNTKLLYSLLSDLQILEKQGEHKHNWCEGCNNAKGCVACVDGSKWAHIEEHNPAWSEDDDEQVCIITDIVKAHCGKLIDCSANLKWLKSLKQRLNK